MSILSTIINGNAYDFSSVKATSNIPGAPPLLERVTAINYEHSVNVGELRGRGSKVYGTTRGEYSANASMTVYLEDWQLMKTGLMALSPAGGGGFMAARFMLSVAYGEIGALPVLDVLRGCRVIKVSHPLSRGPDAVFVQLDLHVMEIIENTSPAIVDGTAILSA